MHGPRMHDLEGLLASTDWAHELLWRLFEALLLIIIYFYRPHLGQGNIFAPVCYSVHGGGVPGQVSPGRYTPPREIHAGIRSTSGRYASYWNAFLSYYLFFVRLTG